VNVTDFEDTLVGLALIGIAGEMLCYLTSVFFCAKAAPRPLRNWRSLAWIGWLAVIPIRFGLDVPVGLWQVVVLLHLVVAIWCNAYFNYQRTQGKVGDRCPERE